MFGRRKTLAEHASRHGLVVVAKGHEPQHQAQGVNFEWAPVGVVESTCDPYVQWGNHGFRYGLGDDLTKPSRRGYIAVRHSHSVPHLYLEGPVFGALTPANVAASVIKGLGVLGNDTGARAGWTFGSFADNSEKIEVPGGAGFEALCWTGCGARKSTKRSLREREAAEDEQREKALLEAGRALLTPEAVERLTWLCQSFDVELRDGWLVAYSAYGDVTTTDDEVWQWVLSVASRLVDLLRIWGLDATSTSDLGWYIGEPVERPTSLDGSLSFLRRSPRGK